MVDVRPTAGERAAALPGDEVVPEANVVMDRAFDVAGTPEDVWPWFVRLGKRRSGWYLPRTVEVLIPPRRRGSRRLDQRWQGLEPGDVIPDWGGARATFEVLRIGPPHTLVYGSQRGHMPLTWVIRLSAVSGAPVPVTRVHLRLRLGGVRHRRTAQLFGGLMDWVSVVGLAAGLRERLGTPSAAGD